MKTKCVGSKRMSSRNRHIDPGLIMGGVGLATNIVSGIIAKEQAKKAKIAAEDNMYKEQMVQDQALFNNYAVKGNNVDMYADGGELPMKGTNPVTQFNYKGGQLKPIASDTAEVQGNSHGSNAIDGQYGVTLQDKQTGEEVAEVEGGEIIKDNFVTSNRLMYDKKHSFADKLKQLATKRGKLEQELEKHSKPIKRNTIERQLAGLNMAEDVLMEKQEQVKQAEGEKELAKLDTTPVMAMGGKLPQNNNKTTNPKKTVYVKSKDDPRYKAYQDSLSLYKSNFKDWKYPGAIPTTKQDYLHKLKQEEAFPNYSFDSDKYEKDKKSKNVKNFEDYVYKVGSKTKTSKDLDAFKRNVTDKGYYDLKTPIKEKQKDGTIKIYKEAVNHKVNKDIYEIYDPQTKTSKYYYKGTFLKLHNDKIKPVESKYTALKNKEQVGDISISSLKEERINDKIKFKSNSNKHFYDYTYGTNKHDIYKEPTTPVVVDNNKYNPNDPRLKDLQNRFDKTFSDENKKPTQPVEVKKPTTQPREKLTSNIIIGNQKDFDRLYRRSPLVKDKNSNTYSNDAGDKFEYAKSKEKIKHFNSDLELKEIEKENMKPNSNVQITPKAEIPKYYNVTDKVNQRFGGSETSYKWTPNQGELPNISKETYSDGTPVNERIIKPVYNKKALGGRLDSKKRYINPADITTPSNQRGYEEDTLGKKITPYIDNAVNLIDTLTTPKLPTPIMNRAANLETTVNVNPQLARVKRGVYSANKNILDNSSNSNVARANMTSARLSGLNSETEILAGKEAQEIGLRNQDAMNKQTINNSNIAMANQAAMNEFTRQRDIRSQISANAANLERDLKMQQERGDKLSQNLEEWSTNLRQDTTGGSARTVLSNPSSSERQKNAAKGVLKSLGQYRDNAGEDKVISTLKMNNSRTSNNLMTTNVSIPSSNYNTESDKTRQIVKEYVDRIRRNKPRIPNYNR